MNNLKIEFIEEKDYGELNNLFDVVFPDTANGFNEAYIINSSTINLSIKLVENNKIVGFYMVRELDDLENQQIISLVRHYGYKIPNKNFKGVEGVALGIDPNYRNMGHSKFLFDYVNNVLC